MTAFSRSHVEGLGYTGFTGVAVLRRERCRTAPDRPGTYLVLRPAATTGVIRASSVGGWFKGRNPTVPVDVLRERWVSDADVVYVGMAGTSIRERVRSLVDYGGGKPVGHQGGRYLWQLEGSDDLLVAWRESDQPREDERVLLDAFAAAHGTLPFANIIR